MAFSDCIVRVTLSHLLATLEAWHASFGPSSSWPGSGSSGGSGSGGHGQSRGWAAAAPARPAPLPLPFQRWDLPRGMRACADAVCLGQRPQDLYSVLQGAPHSKHTLLFAAGESSASSALDVAWRFRQSRSLFVLLVSSNHHHLPSALYPHLSVLVCCLSPPSPST